MGSNLGNREQNLHRATRTLRERGHHIVRQSSVYETEPQDVTSQPWFLNVVVEIETSKTPRELLADLHSIEEEQGRIRSREGFRGPRVIDLDILLFGSSQIQTSSLSIPHPRMWQRRFVLEPLYEIAIETSLRSAIEKHLQQLTGQIVHLVETKQSP